MRKLTILFAALTLSVGLWAETVEYLSPVYNDGDATKGIKEWETKMVKATVVTDATQQVTWNAGWYVVTGTDVTLSKGVVCNGAVNLILADGAKLTATGSMVVSSCTPGIQVSSNNSLTIYAQSTGDQMGQLVATGAEYDAAGIGGKKEGSCGNITINGGRITANGGMEAAGIGGGVHGNGSNITINGGKVTATGGQGAAGIGGGESGSGSNITINGGKVTATGGIYAAGIGGGESRYGENITINGGTVTANGGNYAAGIGGGDSGFGSNIFVATSLVVKADNDNPPTTVITNTGADLANSLSGKRYATIAPIPGPEVGEKFFDATSGLYFEITAVGETNTVKVIAGESAYEATEYTIPATITYNEVEFTVTAIGEMAFFECDKITSITFAEGSQVTTFEMGAFFGCEGLISIDIPASVTSIADEAIEGCYALTDVTVNWTSADQLPAMGDLVFNLIAKQEDGESGPQYATLHVPAGTKAIYEAAEVWKEFGTIVDPATGWVNVNVNADVNKYLYKGQLYIRKDDKTYNAVGQEVR